MPPPPPPADGNGGADGGGPAPPPPPLRPLLIFDDPWTQLRTRDVTLDAMLRPDGDQLTLAGVRDVAQQRSTACVRAGTAAVPPPTETARRALSLYLSSLDLVVERAGGVLASADDGGGGGGGERPASTAGAAAMGGGASGASAAASTSAPRRPFETEWTSPLGGRAARFIALRGAAKEQAMALFLYGSLLRQLGHQALDDALQREREPTPAEAGEAGGAGGAGASGGRSAPSPPPPPPPPAGPLAEAAHHLRRAAGVFRRLADRTLPAILLALGTRDRPLEITPPAAEAMALVCLAEAQALTAFRAEERGSPPALLSSLHAGARSLYARASRALPPAHASGGGGGGGGGASEHARPGERLTRFLALGQAVSSARALRAAALDLASRFEAGTAERCCDEAARELAGAASGAAGGDPAWRLLVQEEAGRLEAAAAPIRKDRLYVTVQAVPRDLPRGLPEARVLVAELPFDEPFVAGGVVDAR